MIWKERTRQTIGRDRMDKWTNNDSYEHGHEETGIRDEDVDVDQERQRDGQGRGEVEEGTEETNLSATITGQGVVPERLVRALNGLLAVVAVGGHNGSKAEGEKSAGGVHGDVM